MPLTLKPEGNAKNQLAVSLAAIVLSDSKAEITSENLVTVLAAAGVEVPAYFPTLYASYIEKSGGVERFFAGPSSGGGGGGGAAPAAAAGGSAAPAAAKEAEKPKEEEVDALDGGMDMFGGGGGGGGDY